MKTVESFSEEKNRQKNSQIIIITIITIIISTITIILILILTIITRHTQTWCFSRVEPDPCIVEVSLLQANWQPTLINSAFFSACKKKKLMIEYKIQTQIN